MTPLLVAPKLEMIMAFLPMSQGTRETDLARALKADVAAFMLVVDAKNDQAVAFYRRYEFRVIRSQPRTLFLPLATAQKILLKTAIH